MMGRDLVQSFGLFLPEYPDAVWLFIDMAEIDTVYPVVDAALRQRRGFRLVVAVPRRTVGDARRRLAHEVVVALSSRRGWNVMSCVARAPLVILGGAFQAMGATLPHAIHVGPGFDAAAVLARLPETPVVTPASGASAGSDMLIRLFAGAPISNLAGKNRQGRPHRSPADFKLFRKLRFEQAGAGRQNALQDVLPDAIGGLPVEKALFGFQTAQLCHSLRF